MATLVEGLVVMPVVVTDAVLLNVAVVTGEVSVTTSGGLVVVAAGKFSRSRENIVNHSLFFCKVYTNTDLHFKLVH